MRELRAVVDAYRDRVLIGETDQVAYYGSGSDELDLVFNVGLMQTRSLTPASVRANLVERWAAIPEGSWDAITLGNHDEPRVRTRIARGADELATARMAAALVLTLPGTPFLYYGEEIGMTDLLLADASQFRDNWGLWLHRAAGELGPVGGRGDRRRGPPRTRQEPDPDAVVERAERGLQPRGRDDLAPRAPELRRGGQRRGPAR